MTEQTDVVVRRLHRNKDGDWAKVEKTAKEILTYAKVVEDLANDLVKADAKLKILMLEAYKDAPCVDSLFYDSPVSPDRQTLALKLYLKKLNWPGVRDVIVDTTRVQDFSETMKEAVRWLLKFKK
jgi:hypothetical protein